jgi:hypothetical protein
MFSQELWVEDDISGLVDAVNVAESGGDREHGADGAQGLEHLPHLLINIKL